MFHTALKPSEPVEMRYSAKAEINTFMRRFLAHVKQENAQARDVQLPPIRNEILNHDKFANALEQLDLFLSHFDLARIKVVQLEIANDSSRRSYEEELQTYSSAIDEWKEVYKELKKDSLYLEQKVFLMRLIPTRKLLSMQKEKRILKKVASKRRLSTGNR